ncbi:replication initiation factor domain-containing protein, partial [Clostridioides difficile]|nr:replication initiation factor domain-containing protein [Clostridioides difficile]
MSIVFETATAEDVIMHILDLPTDIFNVYPATIKFKTYQARWQIGDIYVSGDARKTE